MVICIIKWNGQRWRVNTEKDTYVWKAYKEDGFDILAHRAWDGTIEFYSRIKGETYDEKDTFEGMWKWDVENFLTGCVLKEIFEKRHYPEENIRRAEKFFPFIRGYAEKKKEEAKNLYKIHLE
ncbi:MAG: hypothetical protein QW745_07035 [Thermoplasmata archaeon]